MKTLMVDMDNVITDSLFLDLINEFLGTNYKWNDFKFWFPGSYYTIVEGYIPLDLVNNLFEKYYIKDE